MFTKTRKGQIAGDLVGRVLGVVIGTVLIVAVAIPVTTSVITTANLNGTEATVVSFIPLFLAIGGLVLAAAMVVGR